MDELRAWCMGTGFHPEHESGNGGWCPGLRNPELAVYELRPTWPGQPLLRLEEGTDAERFPQALGIAEKLMGYDIWRTAPAARQEPDSEQLDEEHYIASAGGYWRDPAGGSHQILSSGACYDCYKETCQAVRHPVTPAEVLTGILQEVSMPDDSPCPACGGGYRYWVIGSPPAGWAYMKHLGDCKIMSGEKTEDDYA